MVDRKRILDLLDEGTINASESVQLLKALDTHASKDVERVIGLLSAEQVTAQEALELIDALSVNPPPAPAAPKAPSPASATTSANTPMHFLEKFSVGRILSIRITANQGNDEKDITLNLPLSLGKFIEKFVPKEVLQAVQSQGVDLPDLLGSLNADVPKGELINISANAGANEVSVEIEVI